MKKVLLIAALVSSPVSASNWVRDVIVSSSGAKLSIDMDSISKTGDVAQIWIELDYSEVKSEPARTSKELWKFKCAEKTSFTASQIFYRSDGSVLRSRAPIETRFDYEPVAPDTIGEFVMLTACR